MAKRIYVNCKDYNGYKDVKFVMRPDDFRLQDAKWGYEPIAPVNVAKNHFVLNGIGHIVFSDWSVKEATIA
jgi:hypothetical protein